MKKLIIGIALALVLAVTAIPIASADGQKPLDHVVISPDPGVVIPGGTLQFSAVTQDSSNNVVVGAIYTWEVVSGGGTIDSNGLFTTSAGTGTFMNTIKVTASKGGIQKIDYATVIVAYHGELYKVIISPDSATVQPGGTYDFSATAKDAYGQDVVVSILWEVVGGIGSIDSSGLFTAGAVTGNFIDAIRFTATQAVPSIVKTDTATVKIASAGVLDHVEISPETATVLVGKTQQFSAVGKDAFNNTVAGVSFTWTKVSGVGAIDLNTGVFSAGSTPGVCTIRVAAVQGIITVYDDAAIKVVTEPTEKEYKVPDGWSKGKKTGWDGGDTPPGWSKGEKTGWNGEDAPPGLLKKQDK